MKIHEERADRLVRLNASKEHPPGTATAIHYKSPVQSVQCVSASSKGIKVGPIGCFTTCGFVCSNVVSIQWYPMPFSGSRLPRSLVKGLVF